MNFDTSADTPNATPRIPQTLPQNENAGQSPGVSNYGICRSTSYASTSSLHSDLAPVDAVPTLATLDVRTIPGRLEHVDVLLGALD